MNSACCHSTPTNDAKFQHRIRSIAERFGVDPEVCLENIAYARALNSEHQCELVEELASQLAEGGYRLLIIDSIMANFRVDYSGRGELNERQQKLNQHLSTLNRFAEDYNLAIFMTNQVQSDPGASALFAAADGRKPYAWKPFFCVFYSKNFFFFQLLEIITNL